MSRMSESACKIAEGVFAINKPPKLSSAQVLRELQDHFRSSALFAPCLERQLQQASRDTKRSSWKKRAAGKNVKIGHGGTLDPLATGVLVVGVGRGTKQMKKFLSCTKTYDTVVLFGKSTDTYDVAGKVVSSASHQHITKALVEEKLVHFRGRIKQVPPIYSALKIEGMKAYDYARTGRELPRQLQARDLEVEQCELVEWFEGGQHEYRWPATEAPIEVKRLAEKLVALADNENQEFKRPQKRRLSEVLSESRGGQDDDNMDKQRASPKATIIRESFGPFAPGTDTQHEEPSPDPHKPLSPLNTKGLTAIGKTQLHTHEVGPLSTQVCPAPAARVRVTASSGFYVRSFAHDLGIACGSLALMATLFRSRQAEFDANSALSYSDLARGEDVWGPKVQSMLQSWNERHSDPEPITDNRNGSESSKEASHGTEWSVGQKPNTKESRARRKQDRERRNTSSDED